jgi:hypothetical protein
MAVINERRARTDALIVEDVQPSPRAQPSPHGVFKTPANTDANDPAKHRNDSRENLTNALLK